jgi:hypothetical protein
MAVRKTKIVFEQIELVSNHNKYRVVHLTNRTAPVIGTELKKDEVDTLIRESENLTVEIKPGKRKGR